MDCERVKNLISDYLRGALDEDIRAQVEEHLSSCPECRSEIETEKKLCFLISENSSGDPSPEYLGDFNARLRSMLRRMAVDLGKTAVLLASFLVPVFCLLLWFTLDQKHVRIYFDWVTSRPPLVGTLIEMAGALAVVSICCKASSWVEKKIHVRDDAQDISYLSAEELRVGRGRDVCSQPQRLIRGVFLCLFALSFLALSVFCARSFVLDTGLFFIPTTTRYIMGLEIFLLINYFGFTVFRGGWELSKAAKRSPGEVPKIRKAWLSNTQRRSKQAGNAFFALAMISLAWNMYISLVVEHEYTELRQTRKIAEQGKVDKAIEMIRQDIRKYQDQPPVLAAYVMLGDLYAKKGLTSESRNAYHAGLKAYARLSTVYSWKYNRSDLFGDAVDLYIRTGEKERVCILCEEQLKSNPNDLCNQSNVAEGYMKAGFDDNARKLFIRVAESDPVGTVGQYARSCLNNLPPCNLRNHRKCKNPPNM